MLPPTVDTTTYRLAQRLVVPSEDQKPSQQQISTSTTNGLSRLARAQQEATLREPQQQLQQDSTANFRGCLSNVLACQSFAQIHQPLWQQSLPTQQQPQQQQPQQQQHICLAASRNLLRERQTKSVPEVLHQTPTEDTSQLPHLRNQARKHLEKAIGSLPLSSKSAYLQALEACPALVQFESDPLAFLRWRKYDIWAAALRLCLYWKERLDIFGPQRAFLS
mmetsp:Transcript_9483/g.21407  ORF Transcript_9483/g.21407 Transcript_9483/m.21407 type:complete len:221 (+) Transcript_9483:583-1245(+)